MAIRVTANICLEVEEAETDEEAKKAAIDQLSDFFVHHTFEELLTVERDEEPSAEPHCSRCGDPVDAIGTSISIQIVRGEDGRWSREEIDNYETYQCMNCYEEFSKAELDSFGVPNELR